MQKFLEHVYTIDHFLSFSSMNDNKLKELLAVVIDHYISKWEPIGSKFLHSLDDAIYAPSTLRKYLNILEKEWLLYQPYHSAWRIPTAQWLSSYIDTLMALPEDETTVEIDEVHFDLDYARKDLRSMVETLWEYMDGAVVGFLKEDEYYYLWLNNLLKENLLGDMETTRYLIKFIEGKEIVQALDSKVMKKWNVYYTVLDTDEKLIAIVFTKIEINGYDAIIAVLWPARIDHKRNILLLKKFIHW